MRNVKFNKACPGQSVVSWTDRPAMTIDVDTGRKATEQTKIVSEYDQEIPQSQTADNPVAPRGRAAQPSQDTRKTN